MTENELIKELKTFESKVIKSHTTLQIHIPFRTARLLKIKKGGTVEVEIVKVNGKVIA